MNSSSLRSDHPSHWARFSTTAVSAYHRYGNWLVSISWKRFFALALALIIAVNIVDDLPPFTWTYIEVLPPKEPGKPKSPPKVPSAPGASSEDGNAKPTQSGKEGVEISIDESGVRIKAHPVPPTAPATPATSASQPESSDTLTGPEVHIKLPPGSDNQVVREAVETAKREIQSVMEEARQKAKEAADEAMGIRYRTYGEPLTPLTMWFILLSGILKITYKGTVQAEAKAAQATEVAESESLKRQVVEARMAAMQAQVEPHFLFNTLASIDHLIETDPPRASIMQKNLIALLRASMPSMREANAQGSTRDLGKELAVIRPYLEILKVRMEERLQTDVRVSDGLLSAEFPPMMLQSLVENAIKHGLEPKAEGGQLTVSAEIVHGKLAVTVADTGLGFGKADTAGTGIGLSNIRERLALLYGGKASLNITETAGGGTSVTITVPYVVRTSEAHAEPMEQA